MDTTESVDECGECRIEVWGEMAGAALKQIRGVIGPELREEHGKRGTRVRMGLGSRILVMGIGLHT